jgi:hypothetical protein
MEDKTRGCSSSIFYKNLRFVKKRKKATNNIRQQPLADTKASTKLPQNMPKLPDVH